MADIPQWQDFYNKFQQDHKAQFGIGIDRPWNADPDAARAKQIIDASYVQAVQDYNQQTGANIQPDPTVLGVDAQPNEFIAKPKKGGLLGGFGNWFEDNVTKPIQGETGNILGTAAAFLTGMNYLPALLPSAEVAALPASQVGALTNAGGALTEAATAGGLLSPLEAASVGSFAPVASTVAGGGMEAITPGMIDWATSGLGSFGTPAAIDAAAATNYAGLLGEATVGGGVSGMFNTALDFAKSNPNLVSTGMNLAGGLLQGKSASDAARTQADAQIRAAQIAADAAKFRPVGVTTNFGKSQFGYDANGNLTSAGYQLSPQLQDQQKRLMDASGGMLDQFTGSQAATAPMSQAATTAMKLGNQYLQTSPQQQAAKYMADQQALLATGRERDAAQMLAGEQARGTYGLSVGGTSTGMMGANPRLEAMYNAQRQQDLALAAQATQGGMDYAKFGMGLVGSGGDMQRSMYDTQRAAYAPYQTAIGGAQTLEGLGQNALTLGMDLGGKVTSGNAAGGLLTARGIEGAASTMQPANAYNPWADLMSGGGRAMQQYTAQQTPQQPMMFNPYTGVRLGGV